MYASMQAEVALGAAPNVEKTARAVSPKTVEVKPAVAIDDKTANKVSTSVSSISTVPPKAPSGFVSASAVQQSTGDSSSAAPQAASAAPTSSGSGSVSQSQAQEGTDALSRLEKRLSRDPEMSAIYEQMKAEQEARQAKADEQRQEEALAKAKNYIAELNQKQISLHFDTDNDFDDANVINVVDSKSNEIIRQIPSDEFLRVQEAINNYEQRMAHDNMVRDPKLKAVADATADESLRGAVIDDLV